MEIFRIILIVVILYSVINKPYVHFCSQTLETKVVLDRENKSSYLFRVELTEGDNVSDLL